MKSHEHTRNVGELVARAHEHHKRMQLHREVMNKIARQAREATDAQRRQEVTEQ